MVQIKRARGRPRIYEVKPELAECINCWHTYDRNRILTEQRMINDTDFCPNCFYNEIMNKEYKDPIDDMIRSFWSGKIRYGKI